VEGRRSWSPDGTRFLYTCYYTCYPPPEVPEQEEACFVMRADGSGATQVTFTPQGSADCTDWSPDGTKFLFGRPSHLGDQPPVPLWVAHPDGSGATQLPDLPGSQGLAVYQPRSRLEPSGNW
jgi:Tol biopolymer transport system component